MAAVSERRLKVQVVGLHALSLSPRFHALLRKWNLEDAPIASE